MKVLTAAVLSKGIINIHNLELFIPENVIPKIFVPFRHYDSVIGWGFKPSARQARDYAAKHQLPYIALEDGFLRSVGLGVQGAELLSLVVDDVGIYYDARQPSRLEQLILDADSTSAPLLARSRRCIHAIRDFRLSKYNQYQSDNVIKNIKPKILVIDQTRGDASVVGAMASNETFQQMLQTALANHPQDDIWIKVHPDVICGKKQGFLYPLTFQAERIKIYSNPINPWDFLDSVTDVYTVSSLMGFEALMAEKKVHCFGMPFYAGWGLTIDKLTCERRNKNRTLEQVFASAYIQYARYVAPILEQPCEIEDIISYLIDILNLSTTQPETVKIENISWWKQRWISDFIAAWRINVTPSTATSTLLIWGKKEESKSTKVYRIEDGFIRSVGLGVHFNRPVSLVCDRTGIYFDAGGPSDLETLLNNPVFHPWILYRAQHLIHKICQLKITKYNIGKSVTFTVPENKTIILVPGQVESDASIRFGSPEIKSNAELLMRVRQCEPNAYILFKPHPDVLAGQRDGGQWRGDYLQYADRIVTDVAMDILLDKVDQVHTMTSLTGFEALLRGKKVTTYGLPFYSGWGLTVDMINCSRRKRKVTLTELVAATLILYPTYIDPVSRKCGTVEQTLTRLHQFKTGQVQIKDRKLQLLMALKKIKNSAKKLLRSPKTIK